MIRPIPAPKDHRLAFGLLFAVSMLTASGNTALQAVLAVIGRQIGVRDTLIAGVFSLSALFWTFSSPFWARLSDVRGRKLMVQVGLAGFSISMAVFSAVVFAGVGRWIGPALAFVGMILARSIHGLVGSAATPAAQAYVADRTEAEDRVQALATLASAVGLGTVVGPTIAPFLVLPGVGLAGPMLVFAVFGVITAFLVKRLLPAGDVDLTLDGKRPTQASAPPQGLWRDPRVFPFVVFGFLMASAQAINVQALAFVVIDKLHRSAERAEHFIGLAMMAGAAMTLVGQWGLIPLLRMSPRALMRWGALIAAAGNALIASAHDYYGAVVGYAACSLGYGFCRPGFTAGASLAVEAEEQGGVAGLIASIWGACYVVGPMAGMALYEAFHPGPFLLNAAILLALAAAAWRVRALANAGFVAAPEVAPEPTARPNPPPP
jgi:MFS family permease